MEQGLMTPGPLSGVSLEAHEHSSERRCPFCKDALAAAAPCWECSRCAMRVHEACARELEKCPTLGCSERIRESREPSSGSSIERARAAMRADDARYPRESARCHAARVLWTSVILFGLGVGVGALGAGLLVAYSPLPSREFAFLRLGGVLLFVFAAMTLLFALASGALALRVLVTGEESPRLERLAGPRQRT